MKKKIAILCQSFWTTKQVKSKNNTKSPKTLVKYLPKKLFGLHYYNTKCKLIKQFNIHLMIWTWFEPLMKNRSNIACESNLKP
jgi:hypothetical protein